MRKISFLALLLLLPRIAFGAVSVDVGSSSNCISCDTLQWDHTVNGSATLLLCAAHPINGDETVTVSTFTFDGNTLTLKSSVASGGGILALWEQSSPSTGTHQVSLTMSGSIGGLVGGCTSFIGAGTVGTALTAFDPYPTLIEGAPSITVPTDGMAYAVGIYASPSTPDDCSFDMVPGGANSEAYDNCADAASSFDVGGFAAYRTTTGQIYWADTPGSAYGAIISVPIDPASAPPVGGRRKAIVIQ
jgi:hypothetical protein